MIETVDNSLFPIGMGMHIFLGMLALLVFGLQFIRYRKIHYLILAIALPCTLLPYLVNSMDFFYGLGVVEFLAVISAGILAITVDREKEPAHAKAEQAEQEEQSS